MASREKVIEGLKKVWDAFDAMEHELYADYVFDALELLKEQESVKPYMDYDGQDVWRCGECGNSLMHPSYDDSDNDAKNHIRYCCHCGRSVKWE